MKEFIIVFIVLIILWFVVALFTASLEPSYYKITYRNPNGKIIEKTVTNCRIEESCIKCSEITVCGETELTPIYK